jgi:hypothetical protein
MFILIRLTPNASGIIMPIARRTDYVKKNCMLVYGCGTGQKKPEV